MWQAGSIRNPRTLPEKEGAETEAEHHQTILCADVNQAKMKGGRCVRDDKETELAGNIDGPTVANVDEPWSPELEVMTSCTRGSIRARDQNIAARLAGYTHV